MDVFVAMRRFISKNVPKEITGYNVFVYFRFLAVLANRLRNRYLTGYLRISSNDLATVLFSAVCGAMLSNNSF